MAKKIFYNLDLQNYEVNNFVVENLTSDPTGSHGKIYSNTTDNRPKYYNGTAWKDIAFLDDTASITASNGLTKTGGSIELGGTLTKNTTIDGSFNFYITPSSGDTSSSLSVLPTSVDLSASDSVLGTSTDFVIGNDQTTLGSTSTIGLLQLQFDSSGNAIFTDNAVGAGLTYAADYSGGFTTRSLVDKAYVDNLLATNDAMVFKGSIDASTNPNYPAADAGHTYRISNAGKVGGASGENVEVGDTLYCITDSTSGGDQATVGANWVIVQTNTDGTITGPVSSTDNGIATYDGSTGKIVQDNSGATLSDSGILNLPSGGEFQINGTNILDTISGSYAAAFITGDWVGSGPYTITVAAATHGLGTGIHSVTVYDSTGDEVEVEVNCDKSTGDVVITSNATFAGDYHISE